MKKRSLFLVASLLVVSLIGASCGGDDDEESGPAKASLAGQKVEIAGVWSGSEQERFEEVLAVFEKDTGADVTFTSTGDEIAAVLTPRIEANKAPDVALLPQPGLLKDLAAAGSLKDIEDVAGDLVDENFSKDWRDLGSHEGTLYGVWFKAANKSTMWYNVKAYEDAGVETPETWDDFLKAAQTLNDSGKKAVAMGGADGWTLTDWFENVYLRTAGPEKYDQLSTHAIPWTDPSVKTALDELAKLWGKPELLDGGTAGSLATDYPTSVAKVFSDTATAATVFEGDFVAGTIKDDIGAELGTDANFYDFPSVMDSDPVVVGGGDVAVSLTDNPAGKELIKFLASAEAAEVRAAKGGYLSPNKNVDDGVYPDEISKRLAEGLVKAKTFRFDMSDLAPSEFGGTVGSGQWKILQDFLGNPTKVAETQQALETAAAAAFKK